MTDPLLAQFKYIDGDIEQKISVKARLRARTWLLRRRIQRIYKFC